MTVPELAAALGVGERTVHRWEAPMDPSLPRAGVVADIRALITEVEAVAAHIAEAWLKIGDYGLSSFQLIKGENPHFAGTSRWPVFLAAAGVAHHRYGVRWTLPGEPLH